MKSKIAAGVSFCIMIAVIVYGGWIYAMKRVDAAMDAATIQKVCVESWKGKAFTVKTTQELNNMVEIAVILHTFCSRSVMLTAAFEKE